MTASWPADPSMPRAVTGTAIRYRADLLGIRNQRSRRAIYAYSRKAFIETPAMFTAPPWGGAFPFVETKSMFIGENPDVDFINDKRSIP